MRKILLCLLFFTSIYAQVVTNVNDLGPGSLRQTVDEAPFGSIISFNSNLAGQTILLETGQIRIDKNLTIRGLQERIIIDANDDSRIFQVSDFSVTMENLTLQNGNSVAQGSNIGGAIFNQGELKLVNCVITLNEAVFGGGVFNLGNLELNKCQVIENTASFLGGGIESDGPGFAKLSKLTPKLRFQKELFLQKKQEALRKIIVSKRFVGEVKIIESILSKNTAVFGGAFENFGGANLEIQNSTFFENNAIDNGLAAGIDNDNATVIINNSTLSGNICDDLAGAMFNSGTVNMNSCTITKNQAIVDAGIRNGGIFSVRNSIVADNIASFSNRASDVSGIFQSLGFNLIGSSANSLGFDQQGDRTGNSANPLSPVLGTLQNNGGITPTHSLLAGSPAINNGDPNLNLNVDQIFQTRPSLGKFDIGAFERQNLLDSIDPKEGKEEGNTGITIKGAGFQNRAIVFFGTDLARDVVVVDENTITCLTPPGIANTEVDVIVENPDLERDTIEQGFTYRNIAVTTIFPVSGSIDGGNLLEIRGFGFNRAAIANVTVGGSIAQDIKVVNDSLITCVTPAGNLGDADIAIINESGEQTVLEDGFFYTTLVVDTTLDDGSPGSLREILSLANSGETVSFSSNLNGQTINVDREIVIDKNIVISGLGVNQTNITPSFSFSSENVFVVNPNITFEITNLSISNGVFIGSPISNRGIARVKNCNIINNICFDGGGLSNVGFLAVLRVENCNIINNSSNFQGGGIDSSTGRLVEVVNSTIANNTANSRRNLGNGGGIICGDAVIENSTISDNNAEVEGGGIFTQINGDIQITHCTISNNSAVRGGGLRVNSLNIQVDNSILANNIADTFPDVFGNITNAVFNIVGDGAGSNIENNVNGNQVGNDQQPLDPILGDLLQNGGVTTTRALLAGSPAIDTASSNSGVTTDQRGFSRPANAGNDIGAFELTNVNLELAFVNPNVGLSAGDELVTLSGVGFVEGTQVFFGNITASDIQVVNSTTITCKTPSINANKVDVRVANPDNENSTLVEGFEFFDNLPPVIENVNPGSGQSTGGTLVTISGNRYEDGASVFFGQNRATNIVVKDQKTITCNAPAANQGELIVDVRIINPDNQVAVKQQGFTYAAADINVVLEAQVRDDNIVEYTTTLNIVGNQTTSATNVVFSNILPVETEFITAKSTTGNPRFSKEKGAVICNIGSMFSGTQVTISIFVRRLGDEVLTNTVKVTADNDSDLSNNEATHVLE